MPRRPARKRQRSSCHTALVVRQNSFEMSIRFAFLMCFARIESEQSWYRFADESIDTEHFFLGVSYVSHIIRAHRNLCIDSRVPRYPWVHRKATRLVGYADILLLSLHTSLLRLLPSSLANGAVPGLACVRSL